MKTLAAWAIVSGMAMAATGTWAATPTAEDLAQAHAWAQAKFDGVQTEGTLKAGLTVIENNDALQLNARNQKPMKLEKVYTRGLYAHAPSKVIVRLPGAGKSFSATVGVDSNEQTSGGRGSVVFAVRVGDAEKFRSGVLREGVAPVPVEVDLGGAQELTLIVEDSGDGISCDQSDWADARVTLADGRELWLGDLPILNEQRPVDTEPPFSFVYGGKASSELLPTWTVTREQEALDAARVGHTTVYTDPNTKLEVRCVGIEYLDFPTVEWTVYFKNNGTTDTPLLTDIRGMNARLDRGEQGEFVLHHQVGTLVKANDYQPLETTLEPGKTLELASRGGRPCADVFPYFNVEYSGGGTIVVVGWSGQWSARLARDDARGLSISSGQQTTHFVLRPGEEVRTPMTVMQFWRGDRTRAQNVWRSWMIAHNVPRPGGTFPAPQLTPCSSHQYGEMIHADEASQKMFIDRYLEERIPIAYWWMDAGWYVNETGWPNTGTWEVDTKRFPNGLRAITDYAHERGLKSIVWFEPERVTPGTWLYVNHPEWLIGKGEGQKLLNLGDKAAWEWLVEHICGLIESQGIDLYRQDYNVDPLDYWRSADAEDRQGITENHYVTGYLAYWDALRERFPNMLIDSCASGGHRNDIETMRRSVPLLRSDYIFEPNGQQGHSYGLAPWFPYYGTGVRDVNAYGFRSCMSPGMIPCWDLRDRNLPYDEIRRLTGQWKQLADNYFGDYYPLTAYSIDPAQWIAWQFDRPDAGQGMVQAFRRDQSVYESARFRLQGLDANATYTITDLDRPDSAAEVTGKDLMDHGLLVALSERPAAALITYKKKP